MTNAEETLTTLLDKVLDQRDYKPRDAKIEAISTGGANYTSKLFLIDVTSPDKDDLKLFAKVATINDNSRELMCADWLFATERLTYSKIAKVYEELQDKYEVPDEDRLKFPKFYGCNAEHGKETVIMENLVASGYKPLDRFKGMDWEHGSAAVEYLAKFHALSFAYSKDYPEEFAELTAKMKYELGEQDMADENMKAMFMDIIGKAVAPLNDDQKERVLKYFHSAPKFSRYTTPIGTPVLAHGDYRLSNLLFKNMEDKLNVIAVDFQTVHAGRPPADLIYLIFLGSEEEVRAEYYEKLLDFYYSSLSKMMKRLSVDPTEMYPREKFDRDMKETLSYAVLIGALILPAVIAPEGVTPDMENFDFSHYTLSPNELFAKRMSGIVNDCIRWGVI